MTLPEHPYPLVWPDATAEETIAAYKSHARALFGTGDQAQLLELNLARAAAVKARAR